MANVYAVWGPADELRVHAFASGELRARWMERHKAKKPRRVTPSQVEKILRAARDPNRAYTRFYLHRGATDDPLAMKCLRRRTRSDGFARLSRAVDAIARLEFVFAKTMPHMPHEYTVRKKAADDRDYVALYKAIMFDGTVQRYRGKAARYLYPGDGWRYWSMSSKRSDAYARHPLWVSRHINRNKIEETEHLTPL